MVGKKQLLHSSWTNSPLISFVATVILALIVFECGLRFGRWMSRRVNPEAQLSARVMVTSTLSTLAFILGFTFGLASQHYDSRTQSVFDEAISISTAYHRADFVSEPDRASIRHLLQRYVTLRLEINQNGNVEGRIPELRHLQEQIWDEAVAAGKKTNGSLSAAPLLQSLTEVFDIHGERVLEGFRDRIPSPIWLLLSIILAISVAAAGYHSGLTGTRTSFAAIGYALVLALIISMTVAADIPGTTQVLSNYQTLKALQARMAEP